MAIWKSGDQGMAQRQDMSHLGTEPIPTLFRRMAIPAIIGQLAILANNFLDRMYVGHIEGWGGESLTAIGLSTPILLFTTAIASLMAGGSPWVAILLGEQKVEQAHRMVGTSLTFLCSISLLLAIAIGLFQEELLAGCGTSPEIMPYAKIYLGIITWGILPTNLTIGMAQFLTGQGMTKLGMRIIGTSVLLNLLLDPLFIYGFGMGIRGAAVATILAQILALAWLVKQFCHRNELLHLRRGIYHLQAHLVEGIISIGLSPFLMNVASCFIVILINKGLKTYDGDLAIGAFGIVNRIVFLFVMVVMGLNQGMQPIAGYNFGARQYRRVNEVLKITIIIATLITSSGFLVGMFLPDQVVSAFTSDEQLIRLSAHGLQVTLLSFPIVGFQMVTSNFFQSIGMAQKAILLSLSRQVLVLIPCLLLLPLVFGSAGIWYSMPVSDLIASLLAAVLLIGQFRKFKSSPSPNHLSKNKTI